jgi:ribonuclease D
MISKDKISVALAAADRPVMVESAAHLNEVIEQWQDCEVIGIDTEFVRERTYRADLGLIQFSDGHRVWLVDPLQTGPLNPLTALFENEGITKILHAPSEDLDVLLYTTTTCPEPLFDTQIACAMLGQSLQMGYHKTVEWLLEITIDKGETRSNWLKRPLRPAQLHYAALDVCLLPMMQGELHCRLEDLGRLQWLEEDCARLIRKARTPIVAAQSWARINGNNRLEPDSFAILQKLAEWREHEADRRNLARGFVIKDNALMTMANEKPGNIDQLKRLELLHPRVIERYGRSLLDMIAESLRTGTEIKPPDTLNSRQRKLMASMRYLVLEKASELSVDPAVLASKRELESLIFAENAETPPERFMGWRKEVITDDLMDILEGDV